MVLLELKYRTAEQQSKMSDAKQERRSGRKKKKEERRKDKS